MREYDSIVRVSAHKARTPQEAHIRILPRTSCLAGYYNDTLTSIFPKVYETKRLWICVTKSFKCSNVAIATPRKSCDARNPPTNAMAYF